MRFASWNIAGGHTSGKSVEDALSYEEENLEFFVAELKKVNADILVVQESHVPVNSAERSQADIIARDLGYQLAGSHSYQERSHIKAGNQLALAVLSKYPAITARFYKMPNPHLAVVRENGDHWKTYDVGFLNCVLDYAGTKINVLDGHMVPFHYFKRDFMEPPFRTIRDAMTELFVSFAKEPTIIGADFNFNNLNVLLPSVFKNDQYREAFVDVETAPGRGQQDHLLASQHWSIRSSEVRKTGRTDHPICIMDLELTKE